MENKRREEFLPPIEIDGKMQEKLVNKLGDTIGAEEFLKKMGEVKFGVWLWTKVSDPDLNPYDFLRIEDEEIELKWVMTKCKGILDMREALRNPDTTSPEEIKDVEFDPNQTRLADVINKLRKKDCSNKNNKKVCNQKHYFIGIGTFKDYVGIHLIAYPEFDKDQLEKISPGHLSIQKDPIYQEHQNWLEKNQNPEKDKITKERLRIVCAYAKNLRSCLAGMP